MISQESSGIEGVLERRDPGGPAGTRAKLHQGAAESFVPGAHHVGRVDRGSHVPQHRLRIATDDRGVGPAHADVGLEGGAASKNASVCGGHVGVGPEGHGDPAVEMEGHGGLFRGGLHVEIDERAGHPRIGLEDRIGGFKRIVRRKVHQHPAENGEDEKFSSPRFGGDRNPHPPLSGGVSGEIRRPADRFGGIFEQRHDSAIPIDMVPESDRIDPQIADNAVKIGVETRAVPKIFGVGDQDVGLVIGPQGLHSLGEYPPSGGAVEVAEESDPGETGSLCREVFAWGVVHHGLATVHCVRRQGDASSLENGVADPARRHV